MEAAKSRENRLSVEIRETFAVIGRVNTAENERAKLIRKGGAGTAKILVSSYKANTITDNNQDCDSPWGGNPPVTLVKSTPMCTMSIVSA